MKEIILKALIEYVNTTATDQYGLDYMVCCTQDTDKPHAADCIALAAIEALNNLQDNTK